MNRMAQQMKESPQAFAAARNGCKMCSPLGACLAFSGVEGAVPLLHGSQGCATYIRRYLISHFREPMDIASSNFGERAAIFGGAENLSTALTNVARGYLPSMIGVCTTCLSETIGDDVPRILREHANRAAAMSLPQLVHASTPSYRGSHFDGYIAAVRSLAEALAEGGERDGRLVNVIPGIVSAADLRHLGQIVRSFGLEGVLLPDYADRLDGPAWSDYQRIPGGGTSLADIRRMGRAVATLEMTSVTEVSRTAGGVLEERHGVRRVPLEIPIGIRGSDAFCAALESVSGRSTPTEHADERGRLIDSYVDGHKYVFGRRAVLYGEEDLVIALAGFCAEIGIEPVLCASGGASGRMADAVARVAPQVASRCGVMEDVDFEEIAEAARDVAPDLLIGNSKGYRIARELGVPLLRVGLPIHDRIGGARILHVGYRGAQQLFDRIVNALLEKAQDTSEIGYAYM